MDIETVLQQGIEAANAAEDLRSLDDVQVNYLGKKGGLTELLKSLGKLDPAERPQAGAKINEAKVALQQQIAERKSALETAAMTASLAADTLDVTLPGRRGDTGGLHPVTQAMYRIESIFSGAAYEVVSGPEVENDYYNFEALNIPSLITRHGRCTIHFISAMAPCARIHHPVRCIPWSAKIRRFG